jgi:hypothetical protein
MTKSKERKRRGQQGVETEAAESEKKKRVKSVEEKGEATIVKSSFRRSPYSFIIYH